jgi:glycerophosphoryl diester phosphodiesterase
MLVIAHRGASRYEPENTLRAFDLAIRQGAQMIELDLHMTRDNKVVVIHDPTLDQTTDLKGPVSLRDLAEIKLADAGRGEQVPTLDETLDLTLGKVRLYLEIKDPNAAAETLRIIRDRGCQSEVMLASFDTALMKRLGDEVRDIELGVIMGSSSLNPVARWREAFPWISLEKINYQVLCMQVELCFRYIVKRMNARGKKVYVWTADEEKDFQRMSEIGVDGIVSNVPDRLAEFVKIAKQT